MPLLLLRDGLYVNLAYTRGGAKYFMRHGSSKFLFKLDSEYYSRFPFLLHPLSLSLSIRAPVDFSLRLPHEKSNVSRAICARFHLLPVSCARTHEISSISCFAITCVSDFPISPLITSLSYRLSYFACFYSARYANNAMTTPCYI